MSHHRLAQALATERVVAWHEGLTAHVERQYLLFDLALTHLVPAPVAVKERLVGGMRRLVILPVDVLFYQDACGSSKVGTPQEQGR